MCSQAVGRNYLQGNVRLVVDGCRKYILLSTLLVSIVLKHVRFTSVDLGAVIHDNTCNPILVVIINIPAQEDVLARASLGELGDSPLPRGSDLVV